MPDLAYLLALHSLYKLGNIKFRHLLEHFEGSAETAWHNFDLWPQILKLSPDLLAEIGDLYHKCQINKIHEQYLASGASLVLWENSHYPNVLNDIYNAPPLLFYYGQLPTEQDICLSIIGSRKASAYGRQVAEILAYDLALQGITIVSGMARGIDTIGHKQALKANSKTIAVLGSGLNIIYPPENQELYQQICQNGAVISEFPFDTPPNAFNFPQRNRIISGLSKGIIVIEAGQKSGTLVTVDYALEQGKDIYAVPGPINSPYSIGTNKLIKQGAHLVQTAADIYNNYLDKPIKGKPQAANPKIELADEERALLKKMYIAQHFDQLIEISNFSPSKLSALLTIWEIRGLIVQLPGRYYQAKIKKL